MYVYVTRLAPNEIFSPSNKIHREVYRAKDVLAPRYCAGSNDARGHSLQLCGHLLHRLETKPDEKYVE